MSVQCIRLLGFDFIGIEIAIGIEIGFRDSMDSAQRFGLPINPGNVLYREPVNIQSLVSKSHGFSISIPISIWIVPTRNIEPQKSVNGAQRQRLPEQYFNIRYSLFDIRYSPRIPGKTPTRYHHTCLPDSTVKMRSSRFESFFTTQYNLSRGAANERGSLPAAFSPSEIHSSSQ